ncbi:unnamed protein product [Schistocephalus solidus]|uniref:Uncharacterized protein n=1 Tax=Schistocephalus solidus TaxID=70667 RepID=A0A183TAV1_SCHSO|nr:unnamed protein product [Schistocephalus solidus]
MSTAYSTDGWCMDGDLRMKHRVSIAGTGGGGEDEEKSFGKSFIVHSHQVATPSQLHMPQHGVDADDSGPLQDFHVRDPVSSAQLQYSAEADEMKVIELPGLVRVDDPGFRSVKECR